MAETTINIRITKNKAEKGTPSEPEAPPKQDEESPRITTESVGKVTGVLYAAYISNLVRGGVNYALSNAGYWYGSSLYQQQNILSAARSQISDITSLFTNPFSSIGKAIDQEVAKTNEAISLGILRERAASPLNRSR